MSRLGSRLVYVPEDVMASLTHLNIPRRRKNRMKRWYKTVSDEEMCMYNYTKKTVCGNDFTQRDLKTKAESCLNMWLGS